MLPKLCLDSFLGCTSLKILRVPSTHPFGWRQRHQHVRRWTDGRMELDGSRGISAVVQRDLDWLAFHNKYSIKTSLRNQNELRKFAITFSGRVFAEIALHC